MYSALFNSNFFAASYLSFSSLFNLSLSSYPAFTLFIYSALNLCFSSYSFFSLFSFYESNKFIKPYLILLYIYLFK